MTRLRRLAAADMLADIETVADARRPLLTYAALVLECAVGTIRSRVARARAELRDLLRQSEAR